MRKNRSEFPGGAFGAPEAKVGLRTNVLWNEPSRCAELEVLCAIMVAQVGLSLTKAQLGCGEGKRCIQFVQKRINRIIVKQFTDDLLGFAPLAVEDHYSGGPLSDFL